MPRTRQSRRAWGQVDLSLENALIVTKVVSGHGAGRPLLALCLAHVHGGDAFHVAYAPAVDVGV